MLLSGELDTSRYAQRELRAAHRAGTHVSGILLGISANECARYETANALQDR